MKTNIVVIGLDYEYNLKIGKLIADKINLYFLDVLQYINYSLFSIKDIIEKFGIEYLERKENSVVSSCAEFENTVICIPYMYFFRNNQYERFLNNSNIIYLEKQIKNIDTKNLEDTLLIDLIAKEDRILDFEKVCNKKITTKNKNEEDIVNEVINYLRSNKSEY